MKIKCTFIYETDEYDTFNDAKKDDKRIKSRKQIEGFFAKTVGRILKLFFNNEVDSITDIKAKIIERKDKE